MEKIINIIFDLGEVILNVDPSEVREVMKAKGVTNIDQLHLELFENGIYLGLETGKVSPEEFRSSIKKIVDVKLTDQEIDEAWNAMLLDIPPERIKFMTRLKSRYRLYLLSNTNPIHYDHYDKYFRDTFDYPSLNTFFTKAWYSHLLGIRKPDPEIFKMILKDGQLNPAETAFIDDLKENTDAAASLGITPCHLEPGKEIMDLFDDGLNIIT
jgi:putative hydrolase of the HAD superfamily